MKEKIRGLVKRNKPLVSFVLETNFVIKAVKKSLFNLIDKKTDCGKPMVNIGGGSFVKRHWKVLDFISQEYKPYDYSRIFIDYNFDLTDGKPFPFPDNSVAFFYTSHTLEHIPNEFCQHILNEIHRCLREGGAVRITMPDYDLAHEAFGKNDIGFFVKYPDKGIEDKFIGYFASYMQGRASIEEIRRNYKSMGKEEFADFYTRQIPRDAQKKFPGNHYNWWNYEKLKKMLARAGFKTIYRSTAQGSRFQEMRGTGRFTSGRFSAFDSTHPGFSLFVEAVK